jgi:hypothetical protein
MNTSGADATPADRTRLLCETMATSISCALSTNARMWGDGDRTLVGGGATAPWLVAHPGWATAPWLVAATASEHVRHLGKGKERKSLATAQAHFVRTRPA